jgi:thioredoxin reductase
LAEIPPIGGAIETKIRVRAIMRQGIDKVTSRNRAKHPFALMVENGKGARIDLARAVIDASGTWQNPNPLGAAGIPATGEAGRRGIGYGIPDILGGSRADYAGKRVLVIGGGHSAANALLDLARLAETDHSLQLTWAVRSTNLARVFGGGADDQLPARGKLGSDLKQLVDGGRLELVKGFHAEEVTNDGGALVVTGHLLSGRLLLGPVDRIIVATGQRPELDMTRELRLDFDPWLESSRALGPSIDPNLHSCGSVPPHGYRELAHPEPGYFSVGIKSYGRAPTFLLATGHEQVRSVVAHLAGDEAAAIDVRLTLPETGVCSTDFDGTGEECCGGPAPVNPNACCVANATAKAAGKTGCGCE